MTVPATAPPATDGVSLRAEHLTLGYGHRTVVHGVDLEIRSGALTVLVGANASGKSTLVRGLARLLRPTSGRVTLDGTDLARIPNRRLAQVVGVLPQSPVAPDGIRVGDLVAHGRYPHRAFFRGHSSDDDEVVAAALAATDTATLVGRRVDELSGGQRQRVWISMALAQQPRVLLLDEPTSALDPAGRRTVRGLLERLRKRGVAVLLNSHLLSEVELVCDRVAIIARGELLAHGTPDELARPGGVEVETGSGTKRFAQATREQIPRIVRELVEAGEDVYEVRVVRSTLEDTYLEVVGGR